MFKVIDLPISSNTKTIGDIYEEGVEGPFDLSITTFLIRQGTAEPSTKKIPKDELMDTLLSLANTPAETKARGAKKKSRTEKGFSGTFLSLATAPKAASVSPEVNDIATSPTTIHPNLKCDNDNFAVDCHGEPDANSDVKGRTYKNEALKEGKVELNLRLNDDTKPTAVDSEAQRLSNPSTVYCPTTTINNTETLDECSLGRKNVSFKDTRKPACSEIKKEKSILIDDGNSDNDIELVQSTMQKSNRSVASSVGCSSALKVGILNTYTKPVYADIEQDKSISIDDGNSDDEIELLQSPFEKNKSDVSPTKRLPVKRIQLSLDSLGVRCASRNKKAKDENCSNGRTHLRLRTNRSDEQEDSLLTTEIVEILLSNPDIQNENNEAMCRMAAESAIAMHPHLNDALDLAEPAYAVYLELIFSG